MSIKPFGPAFFYSSATYIAQFQMIAFFMFFGLNFPFSSTIRNVFFRTVFSTTYTIYCIVLLDFSPSCLELHHHPCIHLISRIATSPSWVFLYGLMCQSRCVTVSFKHIFFLVNLALIIIERLNLTAHFHLMQ
jgi:hypothetical protein